MNHPTTFRSDARRTLLAVRSAAASDTGLVRRLNEDAYLCNDRLALWAVADGMGGHDAGDFASATVVDHLSTVRPWTDGRSLLLDIVDRIQDANATLHAHARGTTIGATVVCLAILGDRGLLTWAGDSRAYRLRRGTLVQLTRDHTVAQDMVASGALDPEQARTHPHSHVLSRAVGPDETLTLDFETVRVRRGDVFVLCSDGMPCHVDDDEIARIAAPPARPGDICDALIARALAGGGTDNVTVVVVACGD